MPDVRDIVTLNHGGSAPDNPLLSGMKATLVLNKHNAAESLRQCWVVADGEVFRKLTGGAVETDFSITVEIEVGIDLKALSGGTKNSIHFTTSDHRHAVQVVYAAPQPQAMITLDGYDGSDPNFPLIYPLFIPVEE